MHFSCTFRHCLSKHLLFICDFPFSIGMFVTYLFIKQIQTFLFWQNLFHVIYKFKFCHLNCGSFSLFICGHFHQFVPIQPHKCLISSPFPAPTVTSIILWYLNRFKWLWNIYCVKRIFGFNVAQCAVQLQCTMQCYVKLSWRLVYICNWLFSVYVWLVTVSAFQLHCFFDFCVCLFVAWITDLEQVFWHCGVGLNKNSKIWLLVLLLLLVLL